MMGRHTAEATPTGSHLMVRSSNALMLNTVLTSLVGMGYWVAAARLYATEDVGRSSALVSTMIVLSTFAQLNLSGALMRFLPVLGAATGRFILLAYGCSCLAAVLLSALAIGLLPRLSDNLGTLSADLTTSLAFCAGVALWTVFNLQDAVLTGLRAATWVPVENAIYGALKLLVLLPLVYLPELGILLSWVLPLPVLLVAINVLVFRRYLPRHVAATRHYRERHDRRSIATFVAADYAGAIFSGAVPLVLPLLVLSVAGPEQNAYFYVAWVVATGVMTLANNLAAALTVEAAHDKDSLALLTRKLVSRAVRLGAPILLVLLAVPSLVLAVFGPDYGQASTTLRVLALSTVPRAILIVFSAVARVRNQVVLLLLSEVAAGLATIVLAFWWARPHGALGVALAWLVGQALVAAAVVPYLRRQMTPPGGDAVAA